MNIFSAINNESGLIISDAKSVESVLKVALKRYLDTVDEIKKLPSELDYSAVNYAYSYVKYE